MRQENEIGGMTAPTEAGAGVAAHTPCIDHLDFCGAQCPDCGLEVDAYGNTEDQFDNCCFPDCGCDGARVCMAPSGASDIALGLNVEGMWKGGTPERVAAAGALMVLVSKERRNG